MFLLDVITIDKLYVATILVITIGSIIWLAYDLSESRKKNTDNRIKLIQLESLLKEKEANIQKTQSDIKAISHELASNTFNDWKEKELEMHRNVIFSAAEEKAKSLLNEWIIGSEKDLRKDAITRSMGVNFGKITEHLLPFSHHLSEFDPRDIRFIGSPVDLMIFSGATAKRNSIDIYFVEIKTGTGQLSKKQKSIRDAIEQHRIFWKPIFVPEFQWDVSDEEESL